MFCPHRMHTEVLPEFNHYGTTTVDGVSCIQKIIRDRQYDLLLRINGNDRNELSEKDIRHM